MKIAHIFFFIVILSILSLASCDGIIFINPSSNPNQPSDTTPSGPELPPIIPTKTWKLTIDLNGGTSVGQNVYVVNDGASFNFTTPPSYTGYTLLGFKDDAGKDFILNATLVTRDMTITAQWKKVWTVTIDLNGGTGLQRTSYTVGDGETLAALANDPVPPPGMLLDSYTAPDGNSFVLGTSLVTKDITLTLKWLLNPNPDCVTYPNATAQLVNYAASNNALGVYCAVKQGANLDANNGEAINAAAKNAALAALRVLVLSGANVNIADTNGNAPLNNTVSSGSLDTVKFLIANGADINASTLTNYYTTALNKAAALGSLEIVQTLVTSGADVNKVDGNSYTAAINAAKNDSSLAVLKYLVETAKADLTVRGVAGWTAFIMACANGAVENVKYLLAQGQDVNQKDNYPNGGPYSGLFWAIQTPHYKVFKYLYTYPGIDLTNALSTAQILAYSYPTNTDFANMVTDLQAIGAN